MASTTRSHRAIAGTRAHRVVARRGGAWPSVAAERLGGYDTGAGGDDGAPTDGVRGPRAGTAPFGLPVLAEVPALASALEQLTTADTAMLTAVVELAGLLRTDEVERTTGVGIDHWLAAIAAQTRMDRRLLVRTCRLLHRLPSLDAAARSGRISFAQLRGLALALRGAPTELDGEVDRLLAALLDDLEGMDRPDPDVLVGQVADALDELRPDDLAEREQDAATGRYLALQPSFDGTGGRSHGQLDAAGLACSTRPRRHPTRCSTTQVATAPAAPTRCSRGWLPPAANPLRRRTRLRAVTTRRRARRRGASGWLRRS